MLIKNLYLPSLIFSFNECDHHDGPSFAILTLLILLELELEFDVDFFVFLFALLFVVILADRS